MAVIEERNATYLEPFTQVPIIAPMPDAHNAVPKNIPNNAGNCAIGGLIKPTRTPINTAGRTIAKHARTPPRMRPEISTQERCGDRASIRAVLLSLSSAHKRAVPTRPTLSTKSRKVGTN